VCEKNGIASGCELFPERLKQHQVTAIKDLSNSEIRFNIFPIINATTCDDDNQTTNICKWRQRQIEARSQVT